MKSKKERIAAKIREIQEQLGSGKAAGGGVAKTEPTFKKRVLSAAARKTHRRGSKENAGAEHRKRLAAG
jgi:hypothetical protein